MIEIRITGNTLLECINQFASVAITTPCVSAPESAPAPVKETPVKAEPTPVTAQAPEQAPAQASAPAVPDEPTPEEVAKAATKTAEKARKAAKEAVAEQPKEEPAPAPEPAPEAKETPKIGREEARAAALEVKSSVNVGALRLLLSKFHNAQKFADLSDEDYVPFYEACKARIKEGK